jgi:hypothetical protein
MPGLVRDRPGRDADWDSLKQKHRPNRRRMAQILTLLNEVQLQPCICSRVDIRSLLRDCEGLAPVAPPTPLVVFCRY